MPLTVCGRRLFRDTRETPSPGRRHDSRRSLACLTWGKGLDSGSCLISLSAALNGRQLEQALVLPGRILLAMEEVQGNPEPHSVLRRTM